MEPEHIQNTSGDVPADGDSELQSGSSKVIETQIGSDFLPHAPHSSGAPLPSNSSGVSDVSGTSSVSDSTLGAEVAAHRSAQAAAETQAPQGSAASPNVYNPNFAPRDTSATSYVPKKPEKIRLDEDKHIELVAEKLRNTAKENQAKVAESDAKAAAAAASEGPVSQAVAKALHDTSPIKPLRTFQGDVAEAIEKQKTSLIKIRVAEEERHQKEATHHTNAKAGYGIKAISFVLSVLLVLVGISIFIVSQFLAAPAQTPVLVYDTVIPYDSSESLDTTQASRDTLVSAFSADRAVPIPPDSIKDLKLTRIGATGAKDITTEEFFGLLATQIPPELIRSFSPVFMAGFYGTDKAEPFILIKLSSFDNAYSGMIAWEDTMASDIGPLFTGERLGTQPSSAVGSATNFTANTAQTAAYGTSTPGASSTPAGTANASNGPSPIKSDFEDLVINNINVRAIRNQEGQIAMLYSFIDNNTLLITTDEAAFKGIVNKYTTSKLIR